MRSGLEFLGDRKVCPENISYLDLFNFVGLKDRNNKCAIRKSYYIFSTLIQREHFPQQIQLTPVVNVLVKFCPV